MRASFAAQSGNAASRMVAPRRYGFHQVECCSHYHALILCRRVRVVVTTGANLFTIFATGLFGVRMPSPDIIPIKRIIPHRYSVKTLFNERSVRALPSLQPLPFYAIRSPESLHIDLWGHRISRQHRPDGDIPREKQCFVFLRQTHGYCVHHDGQRAFFTVYAPGTVLNACTGK